METLFIATNIFDRYLTLIGYFNFPKERICHLSVISVLLAAKLNQPISPSFNRMIQLLSESEQETITKD